MASERGGAVKNPLGHTLCSFRIVGPNIIADLLNVFRGRR